MFVEKIKIISFFMNLGKETFVYFIKNLIIFILNIINIINMLHMLKMAVIQYMNT